MESQLCKQVDKKKQYKERIFKGKRKLLNVFSSLRQAPLFGLTEMFTNLSKLWFNYHKQNFGNVYLFVVWIKSNVLLSSLNLIKCNIKLNWRTKNFVL